MVSDSQTNFQVSNFTLAAYFISHQHKVTLNIIFITDPYASFLLPLGAKSIVLKKLAPASTQIIIADPITRTNLLSPYRSGEILMDDELALMEEPEYLRQEIYITGPLKKELLLMAWYKKGSPVKISYQYAMKKKVEKPTEKPTEIQSEKPTESTTERTDPQLGAQLPEILLDENPTDATTEEPTEKSSEKATKIPKEETTEVPTEKPTEAPTEEPTDEPAEKFSEKTTEVPTEEPTEEPTEKPTEMPAEKTAVKTIEIPTKKPTEKTTEKSTSTLFTWEFLIPDEKCSQKCGGGTQATTAVRLKFKLTVH